MDLSEFGSPWIWHPDWNDNGSDAAGGFVHFRKHIDITKVPETPILVNITADTRYRLYINRRLVHFGPVKGDENRWFYDTVDVQPFLQPGRNHLAVHVLRFYHASTYATSFCRMPIGGLYIRKVREDGDASLEVVLDSDSSWQTAIDPSARLRTDEKFDLFLHTFESIDRRKDVGFSWKQAKVIGIDEGWGISLPWKLCSRMIPFQTRMETHFTAVHNVRSSEDASSWNQLLYQPASSKLPAITLPPGTTHHLELEAPNHTNALLALRFAANMGTGSSVRVTYSECYEDEPYLIPHLRRKGNRCNTSKKIVGPSDFYIVGGANSVSLGYEENSLEEAFQPFHFRTFRYIALDITVSPDSALEIRGFDVVETNYPLARKASVTTGDEWVAKLWDISVRTLENCMHDCYEDCPFYEQLQYPMDTRSSILFTYLVAGDDRLARQAIIQMHDSFLPSIGLTASRTGGGSLQRQYIPPFALYWVCIVADHYEYRADAAFSRQFLGVCDSVLETFAARVDPSFNLVRAFNNVLWEYTDWTRPWVPQGVPPALKRTGFSTYINCLYAYTLKKTSGLLGMLNRPEVAREYTRRADAITSAVRTHCFDGEFFTDGLATRPVPPGDYSQHSQIWAVLSGAASGEQAAHVLTQSLAKGNPLSQISSAAQSTDPGACDASEDRSFTMYSVSFAFYGFRALAAAGDEVYNAHFQDCWAIWKQQVSQNVSTWAEDAVSVRSDCHAWGSVPIYEFVNEVAGIKPASPGWATVLFKPRLQLFRTFEAEVPVIGSEGPARVRVCWGPKDKETPGSPVRVELALKGEGDGEARGSAAVVVALPDRPTETIMLSGPVSFDIDLA